MHRRTQALRLPCACEKKPEGDEVTSKVSKLSDTCFQYTYITKRRMNTVSTMLQINVSQSKKRQEAIEKCTDVPTRAERTADRLVATAEFHNPVVTILAVHKCVTHHRLPLRERHRQSSTRHLHSQVERGFGGKLWFQDGTRCCQGNQSQEKSLKDVLIWNQR